MPSSSDSVRSPPRSFVRQSVRLDRLLQRYLMNALNNFDKTDREYSLAPTDDRKILEIKKIEGQGHSRPSWWRRCWRWSVKVHRGYNSRWPWSMLFSRWGM